MNFLFKFGILSTLPLATLTGCSAPGASGASLASSTNGQALELNFAAYQNSVDSTAYTAALSKWSSTDLLTVYHNALASVTNEPFVIGAHRLSHMKDIIADFKGQQAVLSSKYGNQANYWKSLGIDNHTHVSVAEYNDGLAVYDKLVADHENGILPALTSSEAALLSKAQLVDLSLNLVANKVDNTSNATLGLVCGTPPPVPANQQTLPNVGRSTINTMVATTYDCHRVLVGVVSNNAVLNCGPGQTTSSSSTAGATVGGSSPSVSGSSSSSTSPNPNPSPVHSG